MPSLENKVVWITGASSGIGEALVYELAKQNVKLILSARRAEELERVKANCQTKSQENIQIHPLDLSAAMTLQSATNKAITFFGQIDILINNGGVGQRTLIHETTLEVDRQIMEVNYFGAITLSKYLLPHFIERKQGQFVVISSLTGKFGTPYRSAYAASKHALHGFFDTLRAEQWKNNITVTIVCPGFIKTELRANAVKILQPGTNTLDETTYARKSPEWCAQKIIRATARKREEVYIGGKEVLGIYIKRFFPTLFSRLIRKASVS